MVPMMVEQEREQGSSALPFYLAGSTVQRIGIILPLPAHAGRLDHVFPHPP